MATKTICKLSTLALAISAVFTMPVMAQNLGNVDEGQVVDINSSGDYLVAKSNKLTNKGTIQGDGVIKFDNHGQITNEGNIDVNKFG